MSVFPPEVVWRDPARAEAAMAWVVNYLSRDDGAVRASPLTLELERWPETANAMKPPAATATAAPTRRSAVPCIVSHSRTARARSGPRSVATSACMHITAPNARSVFGAREPGAHRITTSPMAARTAPAAYSRTGVAKYSRRAVVRLSGDTNPATPTTMVTTATSSAADLTTLTPCFPARPPGSGPGRWRSPARSTATPREGTVSCPRG